MNKFNENKKNQHGLSLFEFVLVLAIILAATPLIFYQARMFMQKSEAEKYANQTIAYAKVFSRYLHNKGNACNTQAVTTSATDLLNKNYLPNITLKNIEFIKKKYGEPYVSCRLVDNDKNKMQAVMYYVKDTYTSNERDDDKNSAEKIFLGVNAVNAVGASAGVYNYTNGVAGADHAWFINKNDFFADKKDKIPENSVVLNLTMFPEFATMLIPSESDSSYSNNNSGSSYINGANNLVIGGDTDYKATVSASSDNYLYRKEDKYVSVGDKANTNTMQTDIIFANILEGKYLYQGINFVPLKTEIDTRLELTSSNNDDFEVTNMSRNSDIAILNGSLGAKSFIPTKTAEVGDGCSARGEIVVAGLESKKLFKDATPQLSVLVCGYSSSGYRDCDSGKSCYIPISNETITYQLDGSIGGIVKCTDETLFGANASVFRYAMLKTADATQYNSFNTRGKYRANYGVEQRIDKHLNIVTCSFEPADELVDY